MTQQHNNLTFLDLERLKKEKQIYSNIHSFLEHLLTVFPEIEFSPYQTEAEIRAYSAKRALILSEMKKYQAHLAELKQTVNLPSVMENSSIDIGQAFIQDIGDDGFISA